MMIVRWTSLLSTAFLIGRYSVVGNPTPPEPRRTYMTVEYDYKLEANTTDDHLEEKYDIDSLKPLEDALDQIDSTIINSIQLALPNGNIPEGKTAPDVEFDTVTSRFINMCFTESDSCKWVKSRIRLSYVGERPRNSMERVTLGLVKDHLQEINDSHPLILTTFVYPMIYSSVAQFQISPVSGPMSDTDIKYLEENFYEFFHATVYALDGDTDVTESYFVYQDTKELQVQEQENGLEPSSTLSVDVKYYGKCRYCAEDELVETVHTTIEDNLNTFRLYLQKNGSPYFQRVEEISVSKPELPNGLPPTENGSVYDMTAPKASRKLPWALWLGIAVTVCVICTGILVIVRDQRRLYKEEASTGDESSVYEERNHEDDDDHRKSDHRDNNDDYDYRNTNNKNGYSSDGSDGSGRDDDDDDDVERGVSAAESPIVSNKDTFDSAGDRSDYEVYMY